MPPKKIPTAESAETAEDEWKKENINHENTKIGKWSIIPPFHPSIDPSVSCFLYPSCPTH
jgi:hypothetical protein